MNNHLDFVSNDGIHQHNSLLPYGQNQLDVHVSSEITSKGAESVKSKKPHTFGGWSIALLLRFMEPTVELPSENLL